LAEKHSSRLCQSTAALPAESGIYSIRHIDSGRQYIGSSNNIKDRLRSHIRNLSLGCHENHALQSDFSRFGANYFGATVLERGVSPTDLLAAEADRIRSLLNAGSALYNLTPDGQGTGRNFLGHSNSEPISDQLARQRAEAERRRIESERRRIDEIFSKKRKKIFDIFEPKLATLLPQMSFWTYFAATFVGALIMLAVLIQNIKDGSLFILSAVLAFVVSPFIKGHFQEKAKQTVQYQNLVKQRDEQLAALDIERNNPPCFG
jgi:group I intron endonuclease